MPTNKQNAENNAMQDKSIAFDILKDSKFCITGLLRAATETTNIQFRQFINQSLTEAVQEHFTLTDAMISKGWYKPANINAQLQADLVMASQISTTASAASQYTTSLQ